jgi:hypothetical protein
MQTFHFLGIRILIWIIQCIFSLQAAMNIATRAWICILNHCIVSNAELKKYVILLSLITPFLDLNERLKRFNIPVTVVAFIIMPARTQSFNIEALKGQAVVKQLREVVSDIQHSVGRRIFEQAAR